MVLLILACGVGLSASALERPGGYFLVAPALAPTPAITRLAFAGPMPPAPEAPALEGRWSAPDLVEARPTWEGEASTLAIKPQPVSLPSIPDFELISDTKVATIEGRPLLADPLLDAVEPTKVPVTSQFMTVLPQPARSASVPDGPQLFCDGFC